MPTYHNTYTMLGDLRRGVNEYSDNLLNGTSTSGKYDNDWLVRSCLTRAQNLIYGALLLRKSTHEVFRTSASVSVSSSVITLPANFSKIYELRDSDGKKVFPSEANNSPPESANGSDRRYYREGNTLIVQQSGVNATWTLYYYKRPRDLHQGQAGSENTFSTTAKIIADYYNTVTIEDITGGWTGEISDYTAARVITVSGQTLSENDYYGTVSELPEEFHHFIVPRAVMICKATHPAAQEKVGQDELRLWGEELMEAMNSFAGSQSDITQEELWTDFGSGRQRLGYNIPGQGYTIY